MSEKNKLCDPDEMKVSVEAYCPVDDDGEPSNLPDGDTLNISEYMPYQCFECGHEFSTWDEAQAHYTNKMPKQ